MPHLMTWVLMMLSTSSQMLFHHQSWPGMILVFVLMKQVEGPAKTLTPENLLQVGHLLWTLEDEILS